MFSHRVLAMMGAFAATMFIAPGFIIMYSVADLAGTNGMVAIGSAVNIRQGNGVNYSFASDGTISRMEIKTESVEINTFEIYANISSGYLFNALHSYDENIEIRWTADASNNSATVNFTIAALDDDTIYWIYRNGTRISSGPGPTLTITGTGDAQYKIVLRYSSTISNLVILTVHFVGIGIVITTIGNLVVPLTNDIRKKRHRNPNETTKSIIQGVVLIVIGLALYGVLYSMFIG